MERTRQTRPYLAVVRGARQAPRKLGRLRGADDPDGLSRASDFDPGEPILRRIPGAIALEEQADRLEVVCPREDERYPTDSLLRGQRTACQRPRRERPMHFPIAAEGQGEL